MGEQGAIWVAWRNRTSTTQHVCAVRMRIGGESTAISIAWSSLFW
jgi:hypothetical protein